MLYRSDVQVAGLFPTTFQHNFLAPTCICTGSARAYDVTPRAYDVTPRAQRSRDHDLGRASVLGRVSVVVSLPLRFRV